MSNIWDLDGIEFDRDILIKYKDSTNNLSVLYNYIIGNLFYNTELYTRQSLLGNEFYFTTNDDLYKLTGIYSISFKENDNGGVYNQVLSLNPISYSHLSCSHFDINNISDLIITGNLDILNYYGLTCDMIYRLTKSISLQLLEDDGGLVSGLSSFELTMGLFISDAVVCSNKDLIYLSDSDITLSTFSDLLLGRMYNTLKNLGVHVNKDLIIYSYPLQKLSHFNFDLFKYFNHISFYNNSSEYKKIDKDSSVYQELSLFISKIQELDIHNISFGLRKEIFHEILNEYSNNHKNFILPNHLDKILGSYLDESFNIVKGMEY